MGTSLIGKSDHLLVRSCRIGFPGGKILLLVVSIAVGCSLLLLPPEVALGASVALLFGAMIIIRPYLGILAYLVCTYLRPGEFIPVLGLLHLTRIIALAVFVAWIFRLIRGEESLFWGGRETFFLLGLVVVMCFSTLSAYWQTQAMGFTIDIVKIVVMYFLIIQLVNSLLKLKVFIWTVILLHGWLSIVALCTFRQSIDMRIGGLNVYFGDPNDFALALLVVIPYSYFMLINLKKMILKIFSLLLFCLLIIAVVYTGSRGGMLGLLVVLAAICIKSRKKIIMSPVLVILLIFAFIITPASLKDRYLSMTTRRIDDSVRGRLEVWTAATQMIRDHPVLGVGPGNFAVVYGLDYKPFNAVGAQWRAAHSIYFQVAAELGLLGLFCFAAIVFFSFKNNWWTRYRRSKNRDIFHSMSNALDVSLMGYLVAGAFISSAYYPHLYFVLALSVVNRNLSHQTLSPISSMFIQNGEIS